MYSILEPMCRGLVGYVSYLAPCGVSTVYSEYLLYEPIVRIAAAKGYSVRCEFPVLHLGGRGDWKRIDFDIQKDYERFGLEVKWIESDTPDLKPDLDKLAWYSFQFDAPGFMLLFGAAKYFEALQPKSEAVEKSRGKLAVWDAGRTKYAAQWIRYI